MIKIACLFPGQGSQTVGMGEDFYNHSPEAKHAFDEIDLIAGRALSQLCFQGPESELKRTINTQPTILAVSLAAWKCYQHLGGPAPAYVAGHSLGEFTALVASGVLSVEAAVQLVCRRAKLMEECPSGAMSAVLNVASDKLRTLCAQVTSLIGNDQVVIVANYNTREQLVISGSPEAVLKAGQEAKAAGGKVIPLPVGGAFHSPLMAAAASEFEAELQGCEFHDARYPVVQNFDADASTSGAVVRNKLVKQMPNSVRWCESIEYMLSQGVNTFVEIGPGKALTGMVKKIDSTARLFNVYDLTSLQAALVELKPASAVQLQ